MYPVLKWEKYNDDDDIPVIEPNKHPYKDDETKDEHALRLTLNEKQLTCDNESLEKTLKLIKKKSHFSLITDEDRSTKESDLTGFLYHHVRFTSSSLLLKKTEEHDIFFQRNSTIFYLGEERPYAYASDQNHVMVVHFTGSNIKVGYMNLNTYESRFESVSASKKSDYNIHLCGSVAWIVLRNDQRSEVIRLDLSTEETLKHAISLGSSFFPDRYEVVNTYGVTQVSMNTNYLMFNGISNYIQYRDDGLFILSSPILQKNDDHYIVGNFCVILTRDEQTDIPKLCIKSIQQLLDENCSHPDTGIQKEIRFAEVSNYKDYYAYNFHMTVHKHSMKVVLKTNPYHLFIVDIIKGKMTQILKCGEVFYHHLNELHPYFSLDGTEVRLIGTPFNSVEKMYLCAVFSVWNGFNLKDLSKQTVLKHFNDEDIKKMDLPNTLQREFKNMEI